jgi:predicted metal-dependent phosphoesterase TrpH
MQRVDLHTHSNVSDGGLSPQALITLAREQGVEMISVTDHDTVDAYHDLPEFSGIRVLAGVELSSHWSGVGIHVIGLGIDNRATPLLQGLERQHQARLERAGQIARRLRAKGLSINDPDPSIGWIGRPWFAQQLVDTEQVRDLRSAYKKYLGPGRAGDVKSLWAPLEQVIGWIIQSGGLAVLAHPSRYRLTNTKLGRLLDDFQVYGGVGIEVVCGHQNPQRSEYLASICNKRGMLASVGSDFHHPGQDWSSPGRYSRLPDGCQPIWESL